MMTKLSLLAAAMAFASVSALDMPAVPTTTEQKEPPKTVLKVLCAPTGVSLNTPIFVNLEYVNAFKRPVAIHMDLLNAETNEWIAGDMVKVNGAHGKVTTRVFVPQDAKAPFKWNAYLTPQGENYPNMLATTTFTTDMDNSKVRDACAPLKNSAIDRPKPVDFNYVALTDYPSGFQSGKKTPVQVQYNLMPGQESTYVSATLLQASDNKVVATAQAQAKEGEESIKMELDVPADATTEPTYLMATLKPAGKAFSERIAEDRAFSTAVYHANRNLRGNDQ